MEYGTPQAHAAEYVWQKRNEIEAKKTLLLAYSNIEHDSEGRKAIIDIANELIDDMMPFLKKDRENKTKRMQEQLEDATQDVMQVSVPHDQMLRTRKFVPKRGKRVKRTKRR